MMRACLGCGSTALYRYDKEVPSGGGDGADVLPKLGKTFSTATVLLHVCKSCGLITQHATEEARAKLGDSERWNPI